MAQADSTQSASHDPGCYCAKNGLDYSCLASTGELCADDSRFSRCCSCTARITTNRALLYGVCEACWYAAAETMR